MKDKNYHTVGMLPKSYDKSKKHREKSMPLIPNNCSLTFAPSTMFKDDDIGPWTWLLWRTVKQNNFVYAIFKYRTWTIVKSITSVDL